MASQDTQVPGGWNGGGYGYNQVSGSGSFPGYGNGGGGGGSSDISLYGTENSTTWNTTNHLYSRVIVAGGAGSPSPTYCLGNGSHGGGESGLVGPNCSTDYRGWNATGATQISGGKAGYWGNEWPQTQSGSFGKGGDGTRSKHYSCNCIAGNGGGGGGWYGGGSGHLVPASGGSGWIYTASTYSYWAANSTEGKSGNWKLNSSYYLTSASTTAGNQTFKSPSGTNETGHTGNGYARVTYLGT